MIKSDMQPFLTPTGGVCPTLAYLNPPMGTGVTQQPDSNQIMTRDGQFLSLVDQGNSGLKVFLARVPSCIGTSPEAVQTWYMLFTKMAATTGFYLHPYFCFRKHTDSNYRFTCGFDVAPVATVTAVAEILHRPHVPEVVAVVGVAADLANGVAKFLAITGVPEVL